MKYAMPLSSDYTLVCKEYKTARKSVYYNMQQSVVQIADFRRSQAGAEIRTALIAVGAPCLCDLNGNRKKARPGYI